ncbi:MAG TPA: hypothetical protein VMZ30_00625 [Pyrinomonadaceae bacterium]|nr:hypothetical protein [Pyrinomonadaceae bacterium]
MRDNTKNETQDPIIETNPVRHRLKLIAAGLSVGAGLAYLLLKVLRGQGGHSERSQSRPDNVVDDRGTSQRQAARILRNLRDRAFEANDEKLAIALGRPIEDLAAWNAGIEVIDDDVIMKARGIAMHRGVYVD